MSQLSIGYDDKREVYQILKYRPENRPPWIVMEELSPKRRYMRGETFLCDLEGNSQWVEFEWYLENGAAGRMRRLLNVDAQNVSDRGMLEMRYILPGVSAIKNFIGGTYTEKKLIEVLYETFEGWHEIYLEFEEIIGKEPEEKQDVLRAVFGEQNQRYFNGMQNVAELLPPETAKRIKEMLGIPEHALAAPISSSN